MKRISHNVVFLVTLLFSLSGCGGDKSEVQSEAISSTRHTDPVYKKIERPNEGIPGVGFDYTVVNQRLQSLGIPTPATSARFRAMPDAALESMAKSGDKMAKTFWVERLADEALTLQQARDANGTFPKGIIEADAVGNIGQMGYHLSALMQDPTNAMAGYLWGLTTSASTYGGPLEPIVAGMRMAGLRGDHRAVEIEREFRIAHPNLSETDIDMYFESGNRAMELAAIPRS